MYEFFKSEFFNFELIRLLGTTPFGGCEIAEFLDAVGQIKNDNADSWYRAWYAQGERAELVGEEAVQSGDRVAARRAFMRASNYFRQSQYMFNDRPQSRDARILPIIGRSIRDFKRGMRLLDGDVCELEIPYENGQKLPGYLYLPPASKRLPGKIPVLVNTGGADSIQEELYYMYPAAGPDLGYAVLTFEGPGQGIILRRDKLTMRPDWEAVTTPVIDHLVQYSKAHAELDLDLERIAIAGASMGGYYALRGASDPRIKACVAIDPFYDMWDLAKVRMPVWFCNLWMAGWISDTLLNAACYTHFKVDLRTRWEFAVAMWMFGTETPADTMREMQRYTMRLEDGEEFLDRVKCPVLVSGAAHSIYFRPEISTSLIHRKLKHIPETQKEIWIAKEPGDGGLQAKCGAFGIVQQRTFRFLDEHLGIKRANLAVDCKLGGF